MAAKMLQLHIASLEGKLCSVCVSAGACVRSCACVRTFEWVRECVCEREGDSESEWGRACVRMCVCVRASVSVSVSVCARVCVCSHVFNWKVSKSAKLIRIRAYVYKERKEDRLMLSWSWRLNLVALCRLNYFRTGTYLPCFTRLLWFWFILIKFYTQYIYFIAVTAWVNCVLIVIVSFTMKGLCIWVSSFLML